MPGRVVCMTILCSVHLGGHEVQLGDAHDDYAVHLCHAHEVHLGDAHEEKVKAESGDWKRHHFYSQP